MGEIAAQAKGMAKQVGKTLKGQTGIYATLAKEHGEVSSLMKQALGASSGEERASLLNKIRVELISHSHAEEQTLYARLRSFEETRGRASHSKVEHDDIAELLRNAASARTGSAEETALLRELQQLVEHHVEEEEGELFSQAHEVLSSEEEHRLNDDFKRIKETEKSRLERDIESTSH